MALFAGQSVSPTIQRPGAAFGTGGHFSPQPSFSVGAIVFTVDEEIREQEEGGWEYSAYRVVTSCQGAQHSATRRYKEFKVLHDQLRAHLPMLPAAFPVHGNLLNRFAPEVIEQRKVGFRTYLENAFALLNGSPPPAVLRDFLNLPPPDEPAMSPEASMMPAASLDSSDTVILVAYQLPLLVSRSEEP